MKLILIALILAALDPTLVAILIAIAAPLGAYLVAARQFSGKIESSDAKELWAESRSIRDWSQKRITTLNETVARLETRVAALEQTNEELFNERNELFEERNLLQEQVFKLKETISALRDQLRTLNDQLKKTRARVATLEETNG